MGNKIKELEERVKELEKSAKLESDVALEMAKVFKLQDLRIKKIEDKIKAKEEVKEEQPNPKATGEATREWLKNYDACSPTPHKHIINPTDKKKTLEERLRSIDHDFIMKTHDFRESKHKCFDVDLMCSSTELLVMQLSFINQESDDEIVNKVQKIIEILK